MSNRIRTGVATLALLFAADAVAGANDYRFEAAGQPQKAADGKSIVLVRLVRIADDKPVPGAVVIQTRADMSPMSMPEMTAPMRALGESEPGVYRFEVQPGMAGPWALTLAAKVQGEVETVRGTVTIVLAK
ncbi:MAG: FixH family protein [Proteobacteria bacterium]|nr:FixH family protein [Pseudomonadota bacterium]